MSSTNFPSTPSYENFASLFPPETQATADCDSDAPYDPEHILACKNVKLDIEADSEELPNHLKVTRKRGWAELSRSQLSLESPRNECTTPIEDARNKYYAALTLLKYQQFMRGKSILQLLAESNFALAQYTLGICAESGIGEAKDPDKARDLYELAAENGLAHAQYSLGVWYHGGKGRVRDEGKANYWFQRATETRLIAFRALQEQHLSKKSFEV